MKKQMLLIVLLLLYIQKLAAQELVGKWDINILIDNQYPPEEYILSPKDNKPRRYGHVLLLNAEGTFQSYRIPGCGQDRHPPTTTGKYTIIDQHYISFFLEKRIEEKETVINQDLGKFYYFQKDSTIRFIKSNGNLEADQQIVHYRELLLDKNNEIDNYENMMLDWKYTTNNNNIEVLKYFLNESNISNATVLYSKTMQSGTRTLSLIKLEDSLRFVVFEKEFHSVGQHRIALYNDDIIQKTDEYVTQSDHDKKLKISTQTQHYLPNQNMMDNADKTVKIYKKNKITHKVIYDQYTPYNKENGNLNKVTIYFQDQQPIYIEYVTKHIRKSDSKESISGFYIVDFNKEKYISKTIKKDNGKYTYPSGLINKVLEEIKHVK